MRVSAVGLVALLVAMIFAGCLGSDDVPPPPVQGDAAEVVYGSVRDLMADVPCEATVGDEPSDNLLELAFDPLDLSGAVAPGEADRHGELVVVARYGTGGFSVVDVADPEVPVELATWDPEVGERALDIKFLADGSGVVLGGDNGIRLLTLHGEDDPVLEAHHVFDATQAHMVTTFAVDGRQYVAVAKGDGMDLPIYEIVGDYGARSFELVASPHINTPLALVDRYSPEDVTRTHDSFFFYDPLDDRPTLWVAAVWDGIVALDVSDPADPVEIARIPNLRPQYTHTVQTVVTEDDRRITISVSEVGANTMRAFDTTDLANPVLLSEWSVTNEAQPQHNLQVVGPYVYVAHYQEGVFVFELEDVIAGSPEPIARMASSGGPPESENPTVVVLAQTGLFNGAWDVLVHDGVLHVTDGGLRNVGFGCLTPGDATMTSTG